MAWEPGTHVPWQIQKVQRCPEVVDFRALKFQKHPGSACQSSLKCGSFTINCTSLYHTTQLKKTIQRNVSLFLMPTTFISTLYYIILWVIPPSKDASHHQDDIPFLVGNPYLNLHLPLLLGRGRGTTQISTVFVHSMLAIKAWEQRSRCLDLASSAMAGTVEGQAKEITAPRRGHEILVRMELPELPSRELTCLYHHIYIISI